MNVPIFGEGDPLDAVVGELRRYPDWPADDERDRRFVQELRERFPGVDLLKEAYGWRVWMEDHRQKKEVKPRARFVTWVRNASAFGASRQGAGTHRKNQSRTAPAGREAFGGESSQSLGGW